MTLGTPGRPAIALIGQPNVGKSLLFSRLTGRHVAVSNYPGTTVEVATAAWSHDPEVAVVDTPGVLTLPGATEAEAVTTRFLLSGGVGRIVQVGDAKNLRRTLQLTALLAELGVPMVVALNMSDEAAQRGVQVDHRLLAAHLGVPVVPTVAVRDQGSAELSQALEAAGLPGLHLAYPVEVEAALAAIAAHLDAAPVAARALALLWLAGDPLTEEWIEAHQPGSLPTLTRVRDDAQLRFPEPLGVVLQRARLDFADQVATAVSRETAPGAGGWRARLGRLSARPLLGLPVLAGVLYAVYWFVGRFGAGTLAEAMEEDLLGGVVNPRVADYVYRWSPAELLADFIAGEYGLWTMGMTYALGLILPIVATFFLAFALLEDSGYLPRLSLLTNRIFRRLGLNGEAVIPMVLGFGCVTMATMSTRLLSSRRERLLVILLLALAVPCSAQLGVTMGLLAGVSAAAVGIWAGVLLLVFLGVGWLAARLLPGRRVPLVAELPPLRRPRLANVTVKTLSRVEWYLREVIPLFLLGTAVLFVLDRTGALPEIVRAAEPLVVGWLGLPAAAAAAFLMGFLRRDFGAAGLFALAAGGVLSAEQMVVAMVTITLFVPCVASVLMIVRERGWATAAGMVSFVFPFAFLVGGLLHRALSLVGWSG